MLEERTAEAPGERRARRRARWVTYGAIAVLLVVGLRSYELWPLTSYHLFSSVRTETMTSTELVAVAPDGARTVVTIDPRNPVLVTTSHLYSELRTAPAARQSAMVDAWLDTAGIDPADVASVRLERVGRVMDPETLETRETSRTLVVEVAP